MNDFFPPDETWNSAFFLFSLPVWVAINGESPPATKLLKPATVEATGASEVLFILKLVTVYFQSEYLSPALVILVASIIPSVTVIPSKTPL